MLLDVVGRLASNIGVMTAELLGLKYPVDLSLEVKVDSSYQGFDP